MLTWHTQTHNSDKVSAGDSIGENKKLHDIFLLNTTSRLWVKSKEWSCY